MKEKPDWIRYDQDGRFICKRCGEEYSPACPCPIKIFAAIANAFGKCHRKCKEKKK
jgi:hypothetical protein